MEKTHQATFKIKPRQGITVKDPKTFKPLKPEGEDKPRNTYWLRRVQDGDCTVVKPTANKEPKQ